MARSKARHPMTRESVFSRTIVTAASILLMAALLSSSAVAQQGQLIQNPIRNIPKWVRTVFTSQHLDDRYTITYQLYPPYLKGDFNGDGRRDVAILVQETSTKKFGVAIFHGKKMQELRYRVAILGAGTAVGKAGDNFKWADFWALYSPGRTVVAKGKKLPQDLSTDAVELRKKGGRSGMIYWDGKRYVWFSGSR